MNQSTCQVIQGALLCMLCMLCITPLGVSAGNDNGLISYQLVPSNPQPNTPFTLHIVYAPPYLLDYNNTSVAIQNNDVIVTLDLFITGCPPLLPCDHEVNIPIEGLPSGFYNIYIVDADDDPPLDTTFAFTIGTPALSYVPTLSLGMKAILFALTLFVALVIGFRATSAKLKLVVKTGERNGVLPSDKLPTNRR